MSDITTKRLKRIVRVTIEKEIEIEFPEGFADPRYLHQFSNGLFDVDSLDDVFVYAAKLAAIDGGGVSWDGIGFLGMKDVIYSKEPDVTFDILSVNIEEEFIQNIKNLRGVKAYESN